MRVLILTPTAAPTPSGNATTVSRLERHLVGLGHEVRVLATQESDRAVAVARIREQLASGFPELVHVYHASKAGDPALEASAQLEAEAPREPIPWVVSFGGTDLHLDLACAERRTLVLRTCERARAILAHGSETVHIARDQLPAALHGRIREVPRGVEAPEGAGFVDELRSDWGLGGDVTALVLPAGLRPVKGQRRALDEVAILAAERPDVRLIVVGVELDAAYADEIRTIAAANSFAQVAPPIPRERMGAAYALADVVLNTSSAEGYANVIAEAQAAGCVVVASDAPGNRQAVRDGETGLLFGLDRRGSLAETLARVLDDRALGDRLRRGARAFAAAALDPLREAEAVAAAYLEVLRG